MKRIVIFASGAGTNAQNIINYFQLTKTALVTKVLCNNKKASVFDKCEKLNIPCLLFNRNDFLTSDTILTILKKEADFIVLAGFLWKIPLKIISIFPNRIINIHPALLPKYGGLGMYGINVHKAVKKSKESKTGITIHFVSENYDEGSIIFQKHIPIFKEDTPEIIAQKVHQLEYAYFPKVVEQLIIQSLSAKK